MRNNTPTNFTVIISIYSKDRVDWFNEALESIITQSSSPSEIMITIDGLVPNSLCSVIDKYEERNPWIRFSRVVSNSNIGRGAILATAVKQSINEFIAIMDADDFSVRDRFAQQLSVFHESPHIDLVGGWIDEIDTKTGRHLSFRKVPEAHEEIVSYLNWRNPINQMTVMFRKSSVLSAGNYQHHAYFEDMWLWVRMIQNGAKMYNLQSCLVRARAGAHMVSRRRGLNYAKSEYNLFINMYKIGYLSFGRTILNIVCRVPVRLLPYTFVIAVYRFGLRSKELRNK